MNEKNRKASAERLRARWADPAHREKMARLSSERMKRLNADPAFKAKAIAGASAARKSEAFRKGASDRMTAYYADPENRKEASKRTAARMADPETRARFAKYALAGSVKQHGIFWCPPELRKFYRKLLATVGRKAARDEIRRIQQNRLMRPYDRGRNRPP